jgi:tRNA A37 methylthiotransferase MiaB
MFKFLHIPVQAGSDDVLKAMKREYSVESFENIITKFRQAIPEITISTDIICGYPGETDEDFKKTYELIERIKPDVLNISRFWPMPGTIAGKKKQLPSEVLKERSIMLKSLHDKIAFESNKKWIGWEGKIIIDELGKSDTFVGRNYTYRPVIVKGNFKLGDTIFVKIKNITRHDLRAEIINKN